MQYSCHLNTKNLLTVFNISSPSNLFYISSSGVTNWRIDFYSAAIVTNFIPAQILFAASTRTCAHFLRQILYSLHNSIYLNESICHFKSCWIYIFAHCPFSLHNKEATFRRTLSSTACYLQLIFNNQAPLRIYSGPGFSRRKETVTKPGQSNDEIFSKYAYNLLDNSVSAFKQYLTWDQKTVAGIVHEVFKAAFDSSHNLIGRMWLENLPPSLWDLGYTHSRRHTASGCTMYRRKKRPSPFL